MKTVLSMPSSVLNHRLLRRQMRRVFGEEFEPEGRWATLLAAISDAYHEADRERQLVENALEVNAQELTEANAKLQLLIDNAPAGIVMLDYSMRCIFASRRWLQDRRATMQDISGKDYFTVVPEVADRWRDALMRCRAGEPVSCEEECIPRADGSEAWVKWEMRPWTENNGVLGGVIIMSEDITARKLAEDQMRIAAVAFQSRDGMIVTDAAGRILQVNQAFIDVTGYSAAESVGQTPALLRSGKHDAAFYRNMWEALAYEGRWAGNIWNRRKDGGVYPEWLSISGIKNAAGEVTHYLGTFSDIRDPKEAERKIIELAFYDALTGLPNRRLLLDRLNHAMAASAREGDYGAMLLVDLDDFKKLNDTRGHDVGDQLLMEVARRLGETLRETDSAARLGGDEFVILLEGLGTDQAAAATHAESIAGKIRASIAEPFTLRGNLHYATPSIGVTLFHDHEVGAEALFRQADLALYQAKDSGRNTVRFFSLTMQALVDDRARMEAGLRRALDEDEFLLHLQPQMSAEGRVLGAEALLRWKPKGGEVIPPAEFIPIAEECGLMVPISEWVLDAACSLLAVWAQRPELAELRLSINVSPRQFQRVEFIGEVKAALERSCVRPDRLILELTEGLLLKNVETSMETMRALKAIGVGFSIDDFGTGYSSLAYLKKLPLDQIKIDRSFVRDIAEDKGNRAIVQAIISLSDSLGLQVIAEGVETEEQWDFLAKHHCHAYQGFLFSRPAPAEEFERLVGEFSSRAGNN